jgi:endonuclease-3
MSPAGKGRPQRWSVHEIIERLEPEYGPAEAPRDYDPVSELVYTVLSQHTSDANSTRAYASLRKSFRSWDAVLAAPTAQVAEAIRMGGLAQIKAKRIQDVLRAVKARAGGYDLSFLGEMPLQEAKAWLRALPGVGPKTAGCVLVFSLGMPAMVVDTHIYRVARRLGLYGPKVNADRSHDVLEAMVPPQDVLRFHMHLIRHGRRVCKALNPRCGACVLEARCPSSTLKGKRSLAAPRRRRPGTTRR